MREFDPPHNDDVALYRWSVLLTPSTGTARDVVLIVRTREGRQYRWPVVRSGRLLAQEEMVRERV